MSKTCDVDMYVHGGEFYVGSTAKQHHLKDGFCRFRKLGTEVSKPLFGSATTLGSITYITSEVSAESLRSFEEHRRQQIWLKAQDPDVRRISRPKEQLVIPSQHAPVALVVCAAHDASWPLLSILQQEYGDYVALLVPPDLTMLDDWSGTRSDLTHDTLAETRLPDIRADGVNQWSKYGESKNRATLVARWYEAIQPNLHRELLKQFRDLLESDPITWLYKELAGSEDLNRVCRRVKSLLSAVGTENRKLAAQEDVVKFIAKKLVLDVVGKVSYLEFGWGDRGKDNTNEEPTLSPPPLPAEQEPPGTIVGEGETGHLNVKKLECWARRLRRRFPWVQGSRRVTGDGDLPNRSCILDDNARARNLRNLNSLDPNRVIPVVLDRSYSKPDRAVRVNIVLAPGTTAAQRMFAIRALKAESSLWN